MNWYIVWTKNQKCEQVANRLSAMGCTVYRPLMRTHKVVFGREAKAVTALFPRYLFVQLDMSDTVWIKVKRTPGVIDFLKVDNKPRIVIDEIIERIREQEVDGVVPYGGKPKTFSKGDVVRITQGVFKDLEGIYVVENGEQRCLILLGAIEAHLKLDKNWLEHAS